MCHELMLCFALSVLLPSEAHSPHSVSKCGDGQKQCRDTAELGMAKGRVAWAPLQYAEAERGVCPDSFPDWAPLLLFKGLSLGC